MPWSTIIDIGLKIIGWLIGRYETDAQAKKDFSEFVTEREKRINASVQANKEEKLAFEEMNKQKETNTPK